MPPERRPANVAGQTRQYTTSGPHFHRGGDAVRTGEFLAGTITHPIGLIIVVVFQSADAIEEETCVRTAPMQLTMLEGRRPAVAVLTSRTQ